MNVVGPNQGYEKMFAPNQLTLGVFFAIESYSGSIPTMENQVALAKRAEALGFAALWFRDVPLHDPSFGDVGQVNPNTSVEPSRERLRCSRSMTFSVILNESVSPIR